MKLWDKGTAAADWVTRFTVGEDWRWDTLLLPYDVEGTRAHVWALAQIDVLTFPLAAGLEFATTTLGDRISVGTLVDGGDFDQSHVGEAI